MPVIRETRKIFSQAVGVRSFDTGEQNVGRAISNFADRAGEEFYNRAKINAEKFGSEAAQSLSAEDLKAFNPATGKPEALSSMDGMGEIASAAFEQVVERRFVDSVDKDIRLKSAELASKYEDPVQYQNLFEAYLGSMAKGADDRFKNVIMDSGSYIMGSTKIQLADAARTKARAAAADAVNRTNIEFGETIYDMVSSGNINAATLMLDERVQASKEAVEAGLYKPGYVDNVSSELGSQAMSGALEVALQNATPIQQASMRVYIGSQGKSGGDLLSETQLNTLKPFIGYVDRSNTGALLAQANVISANVNAVTAAQVAEEKAKYELAMNRFRASVAGVAFAADANVQEIKDTIERDKLNREKYVEDIFLNFAETNIVPFRVAAATSTRDAWDSKSAAYVSGSVLAVQNEYGKNLTILRTARSMDLSKEDYNSLKKDSRRAGLDAVIFGMASDGNIDALKVALTTGSPLDIAKLSTLQQSAISSLAETRLYDPTEDREYVRTLLSGTQNEFQQKIDKQDRNVELFQTVSDMSTMLLNGVYNLDVVAQAEALAEAAISNGDINKTEYESLSNGIRSSAGKGIVNIVSGNMKSEELNALAKYVLSGGNSTLGATPFVVTTGDSIIDLVPEGSRSNVGSHINTIRDKLAKQEAIILKKQEATSARNNVIAGGGEVTSKSDRTIQDEILTSKGFVLTDPSTYETPERRASLLQSLRETPSQDLINGLKNLSLGLETPGADALLDLFSVLSNDLTSTGFFVNRFGSGEAAPISAKDTAFLQTVARFRGTEGGDAKDIALALRARMDDPKALLNVKRVFGKQTPAQYLADEFQSDIIAVDLADTAEGLALMGGSKEDVLTRLEELVDTYYHKTRVVIDPRFPAGEISRTMYSLEKVFPNEERRDAFINVIASELPTGYRLKNYATRSPDRIEVPLNIAAEGNLDFELAPGVSGSMVGDQPKEKDVYLVPNESTTGVAYYAYYVDDKNTLVPLYMNINGEQGIPMWDESELADYDTQAAIDRKAAIESDLDARESVLEAVRKRPGMRSFSEIENITFGSGGN